MKKSIIAAGAASVALAAMPVVGVFATPDTSVITDNISVKLDSTCSLTRAGASGTDGTWTPGSPATTAAGTYSVASMDAGSTANLGTSTFTVVCNDTTAGHNLKVQATGLTGATAGEYIDYDGTSAVAAGTSSWNITISDVDGFGTGDAGTVKPAEGLLDVTYNNHTGSAYLYGSASATSKNPVSAATFKAAYNVGTTTTQAADTYTGSAVYTLTYGA